MRTARRALPGGVLAAPDRTRDTGAGLNLKERLSSTENLLRAIRSGEAFASLRRSKDKKAKAAPQSTPSAEPPTAAASSATPASPEPAKAAPLAAKPFWSRQISFGTLPKSAQLGVSMSAGRLSLALVSGGSLQFAVRFPFGPDQAFGEKGFPAFLRTCLESVRDKTSQARIWAVLRTQDLDLNVLSVPKLSGAKLDAAVYWTLQKEKKFAEAEYVLDYVVLGPTREAKEPRLDVLTCLARRVDVDRLRDAFREAGRPLDGITTLSSALQGLYRLPGAPKGFALAANIHVEEDASTIGLYDAEGCLRFSRFIRSGTDSMAEAVLVHFQDLSKPKPTQVVELELPPPGAPRAAGTDASTTASSANGSVVLTPVDSLQAKGLMRHTLLGGPLPKGLSPGHVLSEDQMIEAIGPAIDRLAKQVERTLEYYATSTQQHCDVVHLSGRIFRNPRVFEALAAQLGNPHQAFDSTTMLPSRPDAVSPIDCMALAPAVTAALSAPDKGINLLRNYKQRAAVQSRQTITRGLILGLAAGLLAIVGTGLVLERHVAEHRKELALARQQLQALGPGIDEATLTASVAQFKLRQEALRAAAGRFTAPAVLAELSRRAPENVKILNLTLDMAAPAPAAPPAPGKTPAVQPRDLMTVEGIILGAKADFEPTLSRFVIELQASPLFTMPVVHQTSLKDLGAEGQVLYFVLHVGVQ